MNDAAMRMSSKGTLAVLGLALGASVSCARPAPVDPETETEPQAVAFADPELQAAVLAMMTPSGDVITEDDLAGLTLLSARGRGITDLSGLEHLVNLESLALPDNHISDLSPLAGLVHLEDLDLSHNQISDLTPLSTLSGLRRLTLDANQIIDVGPLASLTQLRDLRLNRNRVSDVLALGVLAGLGRLELSWNHIVDASPLSGILGLDILYLSGNQISDVSAFGGPFAPRVLGLTENDISDLGALLANGGLNHIGVSRNPLSETALCDQVPALESAGKHVRLTGICPTDGGWTDPLITTGQDIYVAELFPAGSPVTLEFTMELTYTNRTGGPLYGLCDRPKVPAIERLVNGEWQVALSPVNTLNLCVQEFPAGDVVTEVRRFTGHDPQRNLYPRWDPDLAEIEGTYRLVGTSILSAPDGLAEVPVDQRVSTVFSVVPG